MARSLTPTVQRFLVLMFDRDGTGAKAEPVLRNQRKVRQTEATGRRLWVPEYVRQMTILRKIVV